LHPAAPARRRSFRTLAVPVVAALVSAPLLSPLLAHADTPTGLVAHYALDETSGTIAADSSGNGRDAAYVGSPTLTGTDGVRLDGSDDYVKLPNDLLRGLSSVTVSAEVLVRSEMSGNHFLWNFGNTTNGIGDGYLFATSTPYRAAVGIGNWSTEQGPNSGSNVPRDVWKTLTYTLDDASDTSRIYLDGVQVAVNTQTTTKPGDIGQGTTTANYIGRSAYNADRLLAGSVRDFRLYDRALSADEVADLVYVPPVAGDEEAVDAALAALAVPNADDVRGNITLPTSSEGLDVSWSSSKSAVVGADGVVNRGASDETVTVTASVTKGEVTRTRDIPLTVRAAVELAPFEGYTFAYFTGNSVQGENIYFAASNGNNALSWTELNNGNYTLTSNYGEKGLRDPFLIRSPEGDTFYLIATDLSIGRDGNWDRSQRTGSKYIEVWESHDLITWSEQRHVKVSPDTAGNTWAPEAYYDESIGEYVVFWASKLYAEDDVNHTGNTYNRMLYATTRDFVTFSDTKIWQDDGLSRIDSTVIKADGVYHRFTKDEGAGGTGCSDIIQERSTDLRAPLSGWTMEDSCIGRDAGTGAVEGPSVFKANPGDVNGEKYYLFVDEYGGRGYIPLATDDIANPDWQVPADYRLPASPRHGTVVPVTAAELTALRANLPQPISANEDGEIVRYDFTDGSGTTLHDRSGAGRDAVIQGGATFSDGALSFDGSNDYVDLPDDLLTGVTDVTVETRVKLDPAQRNPYFLYAFGNTGGDGKGNGYMFSTGNDTYRAAITTGNWTGERNATSAAALPRGEWAHLVYTLSGNTARLYLNGVQVAENDDVTVDPGDIGGGRTLANYIGKSVYNEDNLFRGQVSDFVLYNRALSAGEVVERSGNTEVLGGVSLADPSVLKMAPIVDVANRTVTFPVNRGTDLTKLRPVYATAEGVTPSPASGKVRNLTTPVTVTLSREGAENVVWTLKAVEVKTPVLPGLYADPNIAVFGDTYYIYATSDGVPGWGGNTFYVWKSKNLVDWTRSAEPFLTLDGANGNVPWATGNAWAPTIIEKDGKYYFYFSGHEPNANRKMIGVAVADSPEGPFTAQDLPMIRNDESVTSGQAIDPAAFHDPVSGKYYLFWGNGSPLYGELSDDMTSIVPGTIKRISGLPEFREGLFMNYRDGLYHLTYSIDDTGSPNYRVGYATSESVDGPWTYRGILLQKDTTQGILGPAHSSIINVPGTDEWYIAYHRFAIPGGDGTHRETTIDRIQIGSDGLFQTVVPTLTGVEPRTVPGTGPDPEPSESPSPEPSESPSPEPSGSPSPEPSGSPSPEPSGSPSPEPSGSPSPEPTGSPSPEPSGTASPEPTQAPSAPGVSVSTSTVERGGIVKVTVTGLAPGEQVTAELRSDPIRIAGIPAADTTGTVVFDVQIPADLPAGVHTIVVFGADGSEIARQLITVVPAGQLAVTGAQGPLGIALLGSLLIVGGGMVWFLRRPRRRAV
jgi:hypothetical protein